MSEAKYLGEDYRNLLYFTGKLYKWIGVVLVYFHVLPRPSLDTWGEETLVKTVSAIKGKKSSVLSSIVLLYLFISILVLEMSCIKLSV